MHSDVSLPTVFSYSFINPLLCSSSLVSPLCIHFLSVTIEQFVFSKVLYKWNYSIQAHLSKKRAWLPFSIIILRFTYVAASIKFIHFWHWVVFHNLSVNLLMDIWAVSDFLLIQIKILWTFTHKSFHGHMLSFLLFNDLRLRWINHIVGVF